MVVPNFYSCVDDGSSQCCCWANGERAVKFLQLHEEMPQVGFGSCWWRLPCVGSDKACSTPSSYLNKILKRHGRVTVKNYGSVYETSCQDLQLSVGSEFMFGSQDENMLRFIVFNACSSTNWVSHFRKEILVSCISSNPNPPVPPRAPQKN